MLSFSGFIKEHILSIGLNPEHEKHREEYRQQIHDVIRHSYRKIGGYGGHGSGTDEESEAIHRDLSNNYIKATRRGKDITHVHMYKDQHGRKLIAAGTNGSHQGVKDFNQTVKDDHVKKRAWGEVSGALRHIQQKQGYPTVPASRAEKLLGKPVTVTGHDTYTRKIGQTEREKSIMGYPKENNSESV